MEIMITILILLILFGFWLMDKSKDNFRFKIFLAMYETFIFGIFGEIINMDFGLNFSGLGTILAVVVMGGFILQYSKK